MKCAIIGMGEIGKAIYENIHRKNDCVCVDIDSFFPDDTVDIMHICIPWSQNFKEAVIGYCKRLSPTYVVIHSSVPVGTTLDLSMLTTRPCLHSPVRGRHPNISVSLRIYLKYISYDHGEKVAADIVFQHLQGAGLCCRIISGTKQTELAKLLELCRYGVYLAFAKEQERICDNFGLKYDEVVTDFDRSRNSGLIDMGLGHLQNPLLTPFKDYVGGHCTVEDMEILLGQFDAPLLKQAHEIDRATKIWNNCNVYKTAKIGKGCSIGHGTEIGHNVRVGDNVRIGAGCFLPEGVTIENDCFIAPKVCISNDKYPPSNDKAKWGKVFIKKGARIGLGSIILPGVTIGAGALVGAGSIVTKDIPPGEKWYGQAAKPKGWANENP